MPASSRSYLATAHSGTLHALARPFAKRPRTICGRTLPAKGDSRPALAWCHECSSKARKT